MKLFGFNKRNKETKFQIAESDRKWVEENFKWLEKFFGQPYNQIEPILLDINSFPKTFNATEIKVENIIDDLASLLNINSSKISFDFQEDLRDTYGIPYEIHGKPFESETLITDNTYTILLAKSLLGRPKGLLSSLIKELIKIKLNENKLQFDSGIETVQFLYLTGIYKGFGVILSQNLVDIGRSSDGFWEKKWNYVSEIPYDVMAYALATYAKLNNQEHSKWINELPNELKILLEKAIIFINEHPYSMSSSEESQANDLLIQAYKECKRHDFDTAISTLNKILLITKDEQLKSVVYNNIGYYLILKGDIGGSIKYFKKVLEINPNFGYANDNLGYALIRTGCLEEGKSYIEKAFRTGNNNVAYSNRNLALYYQEKGETELAEKHYKKSFQNMTIPVDLLEYHYSEFLIGLGQRDKGMEYLKKACEKGETEAIKRMNEIITTEPNTI